MSKHIWRSFQLGLLSYLGLAFAQSGLAEEFSFMIGSPVASQSFQAKAATLVFRTKGCGEPEKLQVSGMAEGLVNGARRSFRLNKVAAMPTPGVYAVFKEWPPEGLWVLHLTGHCGGAVAGALIPIGPKGFLRESSKFFTRSATEAEIETSLKSLAALSENSPGANK